MSIQFVKEQIRKFLGSTNPEVMAIKGQWGVGKTYSWNSFLTKAKKENLIVLGKYSYISLFGINNLESLKYSLFENAIPTKMIGSEPNLKSLKENTTGVLTGYGKFAGGLFKNTAIAKNVAPVLESLAFISFSNTIVCIDDLERKGTGLSLKDVLGLVSFLKEHKGCKILLLLNDGTDETKEFNTYKEKVLDYEITFNPLPNESASIAYNGSKSYHSKLCELTSKLEIKNIRILKKIERSIDLIECFFNECDSDIFKDAMSSIVLYSWCFYSFAGDAVVPSLDFITSEEFYLYGYINKDEVDEKKLSWKKIISTYGYNDTDNVDRELQKLVTHGYVDEGALQSAIEEKNERVLTGKSRNAFSQAWELFHGSFNNNEDEIIEGLTSSFNDNVKTISPNNLDSLIELFRTLERSENVTELINTYITKRKDEIELFNIHSSDLFRELRDWELIDAFNEAYYSYNSNDDESILELLIRLSENKGWGNNDVEKLSQAYIEDYYDAFKNAKGVEVRDVVNAALQFGTITGGSQCYKVIDMKVKWALTMISYESKVNEKRIERFKINLEL